MNKNICIVFDLDDTLYKEIDFLKSGLRFISKKFTNADYIYACMMNAYMNGKDIFEVINNENSDFIPKWKLLEWYRFHLPNIYLTAKTKSALQILTRNNITMGILSDGRSLTQRNKIKALGLHAYVDDKNIVISEEIGSEKPCEINYRIFMDKYPTVDRFIYVGDNLAKDFITPKRLGWDTIGIKDDGRNIHPQISNKDIYDPAVWVSEILDIINYLNID